jgi:single-strand DNA-binding protein
MLNTVTLVGNLGQDPETRFSASGLAICNLSIAVSEHSKDQSGESQKRTHWFRATAFGRTAEIAQQYLLKGSRVGISGQLIQRTWQDQNGGSRSSVEIRINQLELLTTTNNRQGSQDHSEQYAADQQYKAAEHFATPGPDDDIPF